MQRVSSLASGEEPRTRCIAIVLAVLPPQRFAIQTICIAVMLAVIQPQTSKSEFGLRSASCKSSRSGLHQLDPEEADVYIHGVECKTAVHMEKPSKKARPTPPPCPPPDHDGGASASAAAAIADEPVELVDSVLAVEHSVSHIVICTSGCQTVRVVCAYVTSSGDAVCPPQSERGNDAHTAEIVIARHQPHVRFESGLPTADYFGKRMCWSQVMNHGGDPTITMRLTELQMISDNVARAALAARQAQKLATAAAKVPRLCIDRSGLSTAYCATVVHSVRSGQPTAWS